MCQHHWIIEPPVSSVSQGVCVKCRETKIFSNRFYSLDEYYPPQNNLRPISSQEREAITQGRKSGILFI